MSLSRSLPIACAMLAACSARRETPLRAPAVEAEVLHRAGDPLGAAPEPVHVDSLELGPEGALLVRARLHLVAGIAANTAEPLADHVRLIVAGGGAEPLAAHSLVAAGARIAVGTEALALGRAVAALPPARAAETAAVEGLVLPGVTTSIVIAHAEPVALAGALPVERRFGAELWRERGEDAVSVALVFSDVVETIEGLAGAEPSLAREPRRELVVLDVRLAGPGDALAVVAPARFDPEGRLAYVLSLELTDPGDRDALAVRLADVEAEVRAAAHEGAGRAERLALEGRLRVRRLRALEALADPVHRRTAMLELAGGAPLASELAVAADELVLAELAELLLADAELVRAEAGDDASLAWISEENAVRLVVRRWDADELEPELAALLSRHFGEAGRIPGALEDALSTSTDLAGFTARVLEENRLALEDASPSARVRAHDWLAAQGLTVPGYDPLADARARRGALRAWAEAAAGGAATEEEP